MNRRVIKICLTALSLLCLLSGFNCFAQNADVADMIEPPKVQLTDPFGVNITTGQVTASVDTVNIGGERGLSHSISGHTNNFSLTGFRGNNDKFQGAVKFTNLGEDILVDSVTYNMFYVMRAFGPGGTEDFKFIVNNSLTNYPPTSATTYRYEALGDSRHKLEVVNNGTHLDWTQPDGTIYRYIRYAQTVRAEGELVEIIYPNGFTLYRHGFNGVSTNTGYQIKYAVIDDTRTPPPGVCSAPDLGTTAQLSCNPQMWAARNPGRFVALNTTVETCPFDPTEDCDDLQQEWPTATMLWPAGMPKGIYVGENDVVITNAEGEQTVLHFAAQDLRHRNPGDPNGSEPLEVESPIKFAPRLVGITPAGASERVFEYEYHNVYYAKTSLECDAGGINVCTWSWWVDTPQGKIVSAEGPQGSASYIIQQSTSVPIEKSNVATWSGGGMVAIVRSHKVAPGTVRDLTVSGEGKYTYESAGTGSATGFRNFVSGFSPNIVPNPGPGPGKGFEYTNGNVQKISMPEGVTVEATYATTCTSATRKYCNQPTSIKDGNGKITNFEYHPQSGSPAKITKPADSNGIRPQIRYTYSQWSATYKDPDTGQTVTGSPIWLKATESFCRKGAASGNGCALAGDEVVTTYDYGPQDGSYNNLHLREVTVTADGETRRTCYSYDIYGNRIGETQPNAEKQSCY